MPVQANVPIAICGMGMRLPGDINDSSTLYEFLKNKKDARSAVPKDRFNVDGYYDCYSKPGTISMDQGYWLDDSLLSKFDPSLFSMGITELEKCDPQQRLLLEIVREALEDAAETGWQGKHIGCFVGSYGEEWNNLQNRDIHVRGCYSLTGRMDFTQANRISFEYGLSGPSMTVRVACSAATLALHLACQSIRLGECSSAIVGGSNLMLTPQSTSIILEGGAASPDASTKCFDASANGYARADGINCLYIKRLDAAMRDGNPVRAIIRSTSTNSDGRKSKSESMSAPNVDAHEALIRAAYEHAGLDPRFTAKVECHGTGTAIGDATEANAVARVFGEKGVYIGSAKPNLGHSEGASGITSIMKAILELENRVILPNIKFITPNPNIPWEEGRLAVPTEVMNWPDGRSERISVNSYGIGGTNVHVILDSAASYNLHRPTLKPSNGQTLLLFSAGHQNSLMNMQVNYQKYADSHPERRDALAYTLASRREHLAIRGFCITGANCDTVSPVFKPKAQLRPIFVFTGQGAQWPQMGKELIHDYPEFHQDLREMDCILKKEDPASSWTIIEELLKPKDASLLNEAEYAQPICTALQVALVRLLRQWGVSPCGVIGHSSGEIAAAFAAEIITMEEAILIAYYRGLASKMQKCAGGMAVVGLGRTSITEYMVPGVTIACENSGVNVTLSGDADSLEEALNKIKVLKPDVFQRRLKVTKAYHSHHMKQIGRHYHTFLVNRLHPRKPVVPFYSTVTGNVEEEASRFGPAYWQSNMENPVLFRQAVKRFLVSNGTSDCIHVEIGPHSTMAGPIKQIYTEDDAEASYVSLLTRGADCVTSFLSCVGELHCRGLRITYPYRCTHALSDLPTYPWDRKVNYWSESRVMKNSRFQRFPHHDLLGTRTIEGSDLEPTWRILLQLGDVSWLRDHSIVNDIILPATAYIGMAGEAIRQLTGLNDFTVRDMSIKAALVVGQKESTEIITSLRRQQLTESLDSDFYEFTIQSYNGFVWTKHCTGLVRGGRASCGPDLRVRSFHRIVDQKRWHRATARVGMRYGPRFTGLQNITAGVTETAMSASIQDQRNASESVYAIHPATLDLAIQGCEIARIGGQPGLLKRPCVPTFIEEIYVRGSAIGQQIQINVDHHNQTRRNNCHAVTSDGKLAFFFKGLELTTLHDDDDDDSIEPETSCLVWKPHLDFVDTATLMRHSDKGEDGRLNAINERLFLLCAIDIAERIKAIVPQQPHLHLYRAWMLKQLDNARSSQSIIQDASQLFSIPTDTRGELIQSIVKENNDKGISAASAIVRCWKNLEKIFRGEVDPLELLSRDGLLTEVHDWMHDDFRMQRFTQLLCHLKPRMKILEIGAGTGGLTSKILNSLESEWGEDMYQEYVYSDISSGFFAKAKERFKNHPSLTYSVLDISQIPEQQGFPTEYYDLIIADNVFHATANLKETLTHVRSLLKPDGRLLFQEICAESNWINFLFGLFPGWWLGAEDGRANEPYIMPNQWVKRLQEVGFNGIDAVAYNAMPPHQISAMMVTKLSKRTSHRPGKITLLSMDEPHPAASNLKRLLQLQGYWVDHVLWGQELPEGQDIVTFIDLDLPFFDNLSGVSLHAFLQTMEKHSLANVIWVTQPSQIMPRDPRFSQCLGMARNLRSELGMSFTTIEMQDFGPGSVEAIREIIHAVQQRTAEDRVDSNYDPDYEYAWFKGAIHVGRMHRLPIYQSLPDDVQRLTSKRLEIGQRGLLHTLRWVSEPTKFPAPDEVRIKVRAVGVNFRDLVMAMGVVNSQTEKGMRLGNDCAGFITAVGDQVTDLKVGERVVAFGSTMTTDFIVNRQLCAKIPDQLSMEDASTMPLVYVTVLRALRDKVNLQAGQTILIHSAAGGIGIAAIYYAKWVGSEIYATVSTQEKVDFLNKTMGVPRDHIFFSRDASFLDSTMTATNGRGVDVVLNSLSGELLHASWRCVSYGGTMIEIGKRDLAGRAKLAMDPFLENRSFVGVDSHMLWTMEPGKARSLLNRAIQLYEEGAIQPIHPITTFEADRAEDAFRYMQSGQHLGKVIISFTDGIELPVVPTVPELAFRPNRSYLLVGGMRGIGVSIARWMVSRGARNLVFLSRSAGQKDADKALVAELTEMGCNVMIFAGDVQDISILHHINASVPLPIAGVIQMAMVLDDKGVLQMNIDNWNTAIQPKVQGTWNLHEALPSDLDFFVMTSSLSGICGNWGQANYAAASTFLDAFVQYRHNLGQAASTIDFGVIADVGFVGQNEAVRKLFQSEENKLVQEQSLLDCVQLAIVRSPAAPPTFTSDCGFYNPSQLIYGLESVINYNNTVIWERDPRMALIGDMGNSSVSNGTDGGRGDDVLKSFITAVRDNPAKLEESSSARLLAGEIYRRVSMFLMKEGNVEKDLRLTLSGFGVDSLVSIEIRNWWKQALGVEVSVLQLKSGGTFEDLGRKAADQLKEKYRLR